MLEIENILEYIVNMILVQKVIHSEYNGDSHPVLITCLDK